MNESKPPVLPGSAGRRTLLWAVLFNLAFVAAAVVGLEVYLRRQETYLVSQGGGHLSHLVLASDELFMRTVKGRRLLPNAHVVIKNHRLSKIPNIPMDINSNGFRGPEIAKEKPPGDYRILVLGDSITWGDALPDELVYVRRMEAALRELLPGRALTVINGGIGDVGTTEEVDILEERGLQVLPDLVVLEWYLNDSRPPWGFSGELGGRGWLRGHSILAEKLYTYLRLDSWLLKDKGERRFRWARDAQTLPWADDHAAFLRLASEANYDWGAAWDPASWRVIEDRFDRLQALAARHDFQVAVVAFPVRFQVEAHFVDDSPQERVGALSRARGFWYHNLLPGLREHRDEDLFYDQCHPRPGGNELIGREIARFLAPLIRGRDERTDGEPASSPLPGGPTPGSDPR
jgi:lysophospholipase L1-like esterase